MLAIRIRQLPHKPFCLPTHSYFHNNKHDISSRRLITAKNKHDISYAKLVTARKSITSHQNISYENCAAKSIRAHKDDISLRPKSAKSHQEESMQQNATHLIRTFHNGRNVWHLIRKSRQKIMQQKTYDFKTTPATKVKKQNANNRRRKTSLTIDCNQPRL